MSGGIGELFKKIGNAFNVGNLLTKTNDVVDVGGIATKDTVFTFVSTYFRRNFFVMFNSSIGGYISENPTQYEKELYSNGEHSNYITRAVFSPSLKYLMLRNDTSKFHIQYTRVIGIRYDNTDADIPTQLIKLGVFENDNITLKEGIYFENGSFKLVTIKANNDLVVNEIPAWQNVKTYVDNLVVSSVQYQGAYDATTNPALLSALKGYMYTVTVAGNFGGFWNPSLEIGDVIIAEIDAPSVLSDWTVVNKNLDAASIKFSYESNADTNAFTDAEQDKLGLISVTQPINLDTIASNVATNNAKVSNVTTDLSIANRTANTLDVVSSDGTDATIPAATTSLSGLMNGTDKTKLDFISVTQAVNLNTIASDTATNNAKVSNVTTDLSIANRTANTLDVVSSDGTDATIPTVTTALAGLMTGADKSKLDGISANADVTITTLNNASLSSVTVATDDKVLIKDTSDSNNLKTVTAGSLKPELQKTVVILNPQNSDDFLLMESSKAITITKVIHAVWGGTVPFNLLHSGGPKLWTSPKVSSSSARVSETVFTDNTCIANAQVRFQVDSITGITGTPTQFELTVTYTED